MANREFNHVIRLLPQRDEVVVYPRLVLPRVVEVEALGLYVVAAQLLLLKPRQLAQEPLLVHHAHAPYHHDAVREDEDLRRVYRRVEVGRGFY